MHPVYGPLTTGWLVQWAILWGSWLVWPLLGWLAWRAVRRIPSRSTGRKVGIVCAWVLALWFVEMRFIEPALIVERRTVLSLGFEARLAVISDYHLGLYKSPAFLQRVVNRLNAMALDAVLIAGDHTHEPDQPLNELLAPLARLRHPAFSVPGNHEESLPGPPIRGELRRALQAVGVVPLEYRHAVRDRFVLVGLGDHLAGLDRIEPLLLAPADKPRIVLMHNPDTAMSLPPASAALAVAGHTHGGQIRFPMLYRHIIPCRHPFDSGLHTFAPVPTFVTTGLGEVGLPMRFLNPPVIDVLEIH